jgi:hypothetical protein
VRTLSWRFSIGDSMNHLEATNNLEAGKVSLGLVVRVLTHSFVPSVPVPIASVPAHESALVAFRAQHAAAGLLGILVCRTVCSGVASSMRVCVLADGLRTHDTTNCLPNHGILPLLLRYKFACRDDRMAG